MKHTKNESISNYAQTKQLKKIQTQAREKKNIYQQRQRHDKKTGKK